MATGKERYPKFIAGPTIMIKTKEILYPKQSHLHKKKRSEEFFRPPSFKLKCHLSFPVELAGSSFSKLLAPYHPAYRVLRCPSRFYRSQRTEPGSGCARYWACRRC